MSQSFSLRQTLLCRVCRQELNEKKKTELQIEVAIFGAAPYAICCCCGLEPDDRSDRNYRRRFRRHRLAHIVTWPPCTCGEAMRAIGEVSAACQLPRELHARAAS